MLTKPPDHHELTPKRLYQTSSVRPLDGSHRSTTSPNCRYYPRTARDNSPNRLVGICCDRPILDKTLATQNDISEFNVAALGSSHEDIV